MELVEQPLESFWPRLPEDQEGLPSSPMVLRRVRISKNVGRTEGSVCQHSHMRVL